MRQPVSPRRVSLALTVFATALLLGVTGAAEADTQYKLQPIVKLGDTVAGLDVKTASGALNIEALADRGQILFSTWVAPFRTGAALIEYADGTFTPIAVPGGEGPVGTWPEDLVGYGPAGMNPLGNVVFTAVSYNDGEVIDLGTFLWDVRSQKTTPVARQGMPAGSDLTLEQASWFSPVINNRGEIAFPAFAKKADGESLNVGIFFTAPGGPILPVAVPGQELPGGHKLAFAELPTLNEAGAIAFRANREDDPDDGNNQAYLWEQGKITLLVATGADAPGGGKIARIQDAWVNDKNRNVLILARRNNAESGPASLYLWSEGKLAPVAVPGQELPGGGQFREITLIQYGVSTPNSLGQHAFIARLADGATAAYLMDADGKLSLILKSGTTTELGQVTRIGRTSFTPGLATGGNGVGLNSKGQVALPVQIDGGPYTIVLLTPVAQ